jgi:hypothetical protein
MLSFEEFINESTDLPIKITEVKTYLASTFKGIDQVGITGVKDYAKTGNGLFATGEKSQQPLWANQYVYKYNNKILLVYKDVATSKDLTYYVFDNESEFKKIGYNGDQNKYGSFAKNKESLEELMKNAEESK